MGLILWIVDVIDKHYSGSLGNKFFNTLGVAGAFVAILFGGMRLLERILYRQDKNKQSHPPKQFIILSGLIVLVLIIIGFFVWFALGISQV